MLEDGVYLNLDEDRYFAEPRLGSTDLSRLYLTREGWWWKSHLNPDRVEESEEAKVFGKALHALVLEGDEAYAERFAVVPDQNEERRKHGERFCVTVSEIVEALERRGFNPKGGQKKEWLIDYCRTRAPDLIIWDAMIAKWRKDIGNRDGVSTVEDRQLKIMAAAVRSHSEVGVLFRYDSGNVPLPEVSILWHDEHGIPRRARLDQMQPMTTIDVKTIQNVGGRPLTFAVGEHVAKMGYHVQLADHHVARRIAYRFITQGKVFDGVPEDQRTADSVARYERELAWIKRFPAEAPSWDYSWLFYQKPDARTGVAPIVLPWGEDWGSDLHVQGVRCRLEAIQTYRRCMAQFGPDTPWTRVEPVHSTAETSVHRIIVPAWIGGHEHVPGEEEDL